ncbi:MAG: T9SS C-terminal target domain-containing protein, partial [Ignavibacteriales bacterium]
EIIFDDNITESDTGRYQAIELDGSPVTGWPLKVIQNTSFQQPLLGDLNNDGTLDMVGGSFNFDFNNKQVFVFAWDTGLPYNRQTIVNPMYQFGPAHDGLFIDPGTIPVELESFTSSVSGNTINLNWVTVTETNNFGFKLYRNGSDISFIDGHGTSLEKHTYSYTDAKMKDGVYNYSLEQIDFDGSINKLGNVIALVENTPGEFILDQNYPNPFNPVTKIKYNIPVETKVRIEIVNILGQVVDILTDEFHERGTHTKLWDAGNNTSGIYFAILKAESTKTGKSFNRTIKMSLVR